MRYERFTDSSTRNSGTTTLSLNFLEYFGLSPDILQVLTYVVHIYLLWYKNYRWFIIILFSVFQTSFDVDEDFKGGFLNVVVNQERVKYQPFQVELTLVYSGRH